ncbi:MAG TPA: hypothetical protein VM734_31630 [Kofleriaceae bacterium]|jgi:hypothetical protein|nr:hypothetical protein [Kofleriaceae bacterium]
MSRALTCLASLAVVLTVSAAPAAAGTYVSLGFGGTPALHGEMTESLAGDTAGANSRLAVGVGAGEVALEGSLSRFALGMGDATVAGAHLRIGLPFAGGFGAYTRFGFERLWLGEESDNLGGDSATGIALGLGLEYRMRLPTLGQAGAWMEVSQDRFTTEVGTGRARMWTLGLLVGL